MVKAVLYIYITKCYFIGLGLGGTAIHGFDPSLEIVYWPTPSGTAISDFPLGAVIPAHTLPYSPLLSVKVAGANLYSKARVSG